MRIRSLRPAWAVGITSCALAALGGPAGAQEGSIVDVASRAGSFETLLTAAKAAGLAETLATGGPFTVFAPTDAAFAALPKGALEALLADPAALRRVLLHHVAQAARPAAEVVQYEAVRTLADTRLSIEAKGGVVRIGGARVITADVKARNGVIHVIDAVLLPPQAAATAQAPRARTIVDVAAADGRFETLLAAAKAAGLAEVLAGEGPFTVFAPTDDAFAALPAGAIEALVRDPARLRTILTHHVVAGRLAAGAVVGRAGLETVGGTTLRVDARDAAGAGVFVGGARVLVADVAASNGVIHVIDRVLLPPAATGETGRATPTPGKHAGDQGRFPRLEAESLERVRYTLPGGLTGERNLVLIAFQQWQQRECDSWLGWLEDGPLARREGFAWWELPTIAPMGEAFQRWVDDGMRRGIADAAARGRTITLWTDKAAFKRALRIESERAITVALLDRDGNVLWRTTGRFTPEKGAALEAALRGHVPAGAPTGAACPAQGGL